MKIKFKMNSSQKVSTLINRGVRLVRPGARTQHVHRILVRPRRQPKDSQSPNLRSSSAMYPHWLRHRWSRSAPSVIRSAPCRASRPADVAVAQNDLPSSCATGPVSVAHPASRSTTSPSPSETVMIRPAADETITRDGRPLGQAVTSYVADGPASQAR